MISEQQKKNYNAFWDHDAFERIVLYAEVSNGDLQSRSNCFSADYDEEYAAVANTASSPDEIQKKWKDLNYRLSYETDKIANTTFYADAFPTVFTNFGPGCLAACVGGNFDLAPDTVWFDRNPIIKDWQALPDVGFDTDSEMWELTEGFTKLFCENSGGKYFTSVSDIGGTLDIIASLRGSQELLFDMYDYHDEVMSLLANLRPIWADAYKRLTDIMFAHQDGMTSWMPIWCQKRYYPTQCDFSAMISPDMFDDVVLPDLKWQTEILDHSIYHLDGPGQIAHLDSLLSLPRLDAIQWVPGAGNYDVMDEAWFDMYEKIQAAGKNLVLFTDKPQQIENFLNHVKTTKGIFIWAKPTEHKEAEDLVSMVNSIGVK